MTTTVSFELAKLLKDNEFEIKGDCGIYAGYPSVIYFPSNYNYQTYNSVIGRDFNIHALAPTIAEVVMWLYEKHEIWIYTKPVLDEDGEWIFKGCVKLMNNFKAKENQTKLLREPTEAYEAAIEYVLKNLI